MSRRVAVSKKVGGALDVYPTPAWVTRRLLEELDLPKGGLWMEPAVGDGAIIRTIREWPGLEHQRWTAMDIREECGAQLADLSDVTFTTGNFLETYQSFPRHDVIITNPPYSLAREFVDAARTIAPLVIMLLRLNWFGSDKRASYFRELGGMPEQALVLPNRPSFVKGALASHDSCEYAWMVFTQRRVSETRVRVLAISSEADRGVREKPKPKDPSAPKPKRKKKGEVAEPRAEAAE